MQPLLPDPPAPTTLRRDALVAFALVLLPAVAFVLMAISWAYNRTPLRATWALVPFELGGVVLAVRTTYRLTRLSRRERPRGTALAIVAIPFGVIFASFGALVAFLSTVRFTRGRQLRRFGQPLLPPLGAGERWSAAAEHESDDLDVAPELRAPLAAQWRENGRTEHASVAAFAKLGLDLIALGAPPALLAAANRDALDEIRHAELCFALARRLDGRAIEPQPFPAARRASSLPLPRPLALARLAVDSLVDGALHEGVSARILVQLGRRAEPGIAGMLRDIAADEGRHSAHSWDVVEWCLATGGAPVARALRGAVASLPRAMRSPLPAAAARGEWLRYGIHDHALEAEEYQKALAHVIRRVDELTLPAAEPARARA